MSKAEEESDDTATKMTRSRIRAITPTSTQRPQSDFLRQRLRGQTEIDGVNRRESPRKIGDNPKK
jgi:hypothetical protein